jgi:cytochrome c
VVLGGALFGLMTACNSLDEPAPQSGFRLIVPVDDRPTQQALTTLPPISGGTLAVSADGRFAVAADPDRNRVSIVDLQTQVVKHVALEAGDEPGRVVIDASGHAFVALRRAGAVVNIDMASAQIQQRTHVCSAARGLALDASLGLLHVACADGRLVTLHAAHGDVVRELTFDADLRDVMVRGDHVLVSTFKSAELLSVDATGEIDARSTAGSVLSAGKQVMQDNGAIEIGPVQSMRAHLAWRTAQSAKGEVVMLHQSASDAVVDIQAPTTQNASPYGGGGGFGCSGIVGPALTSIDAQGQVHTTSVSSGVLSVDMAVSTRGQIAIVQAGAADSRAPRATTVFDTPGAPFASAGSAPPSLFAGPSPGGSLAQIPDGIDIAEVGTSQVTIIDSQSVQRLEQADPGPGSCQGGIPFPIVGQATAVAFSPTGDMIVQSREPSLITRIPAAFADGAFNSGAAATTIQLGGESVRDTGHEIFHRDAGGGIACASCHAEGAEDGHTWKFTRLGERRTQALHVGLEGTAPFHWNGDEADMGHLMEDVFVGRMGGVHQSGARLDALTDWLFALRPPTAIVDATSEAAVRGKALFESAETGCTSCHAGDKLTNNKNWDVGTGGSMQVPSLLGVGYRAPLMHNGCATTLKDRFNPACGGSKHGHTDQLKGAQLDDMVAYLRTL